jgi:hypothetical protein
MFRWLSKQKATWARAHELAAAYRHQRSLDEDYYEWVRSYNRSVRDIERMQAYFNIPHHDIRHCPSKGNK